jgi:hypothetical protein
MLTLEYLMDTVADRQNERGKSPAAQALRQLLEQMQDRRDSLSLAYGQISRAINHRNELAADRTCDTIGLILLTIVSSAMPGRLSEIASRIACSLEVATRDLPAEKRFAAARGWR